MAIVEHKPVASDPKPLILGVALLVLIIVGVGFVIWSMTRSHKPKQIVLSKEQAAEQSAGGPSAAVPPGPPFPAAPPLEQAPDPGATMITLDLKNTTIAEALAALEKQSNIKLQSHNQGPQSFLAAMAGNRINLSVNNQPYWLAFRELMKTANLTPYSSWENRDKIQLTQGRASDLLDNPTITTGSSMLVLKSVISRFNADLTSTRPGGGRSLNVYMTAYVEPKLNAYKILPNARIEAAVDEKGTSLIRPIDPWDDRNSGNQRNRYICEIDAKLNFPPSAGQKIARLKGYVSVITAGGKEETVKLEDPLNLKNRDQKIDNTLVRVVSIRKSGNEQYDARFQAPANSPLFSEWDDYSKPFKLFDANGKEFRHNGTWGGGGSRTYTEFGVYFKIEPSHSQPASLQITLPSQVREIRVPFEFTDLPLPH